MNNINELKSAKSSGSVSEQIVFIGSSFTFPEMVLRLVQAEFGGIGVQLFDKLETDSGGKVALMPRLVLVEDRFADKVENRLEEISAHFGGAQVALAYRDTEVARRLLLRQRSDESLAGLRFIPLSAPIACWMSILRILLSGDFVVPGELLDAAAPEPDGHIPPLPLDEILTERECEVIECVAKGDRNKAIASALGVSEHTVKLHIHHIIRKIGVENRTSAANWYLARHQPGGPSRLPL